VAGRIDALEKSIHHFGGLDEKRNEKGADVTRRPVRTPGE